jgi:hypothetical protein
MRYVEKIVLTLMAIFIFNAGGVVAASPAQEQLRQSIDDILEVLRNSELKADSQKENRRVTLEEVPLRNPSLWSCSVNCSKIPISAKWKGIPMKKLFF